MDELYTYVVTKLVVGAPPLDSREYWNVGTDIVYAVPAGADWYMFEIFYPAVQGGGVMLAQDFSPFDNGIIPMSFTTADYYGKYICDRMNGVPEEGEALTSAQLGNVV